MHYARAKMFGGCSGRNYMMYQRPTIGSQQLWAEAVGDDNYTFDSMLPFYEKSLNFTPPNDKWRLANSTFEYDVSALGSGDGPLSLTYPNYVYSFATWAYEALQQIGIPTRDGFQNGDILGHSYVPFTIQADTMLRESSETAFLQNTLGDPNYTLYPLTLAKKVIFNDLNSATGVLVDTQGKEYLLSARKEIIISSGFIGSPQLLQVSGIGPSDLLTELGIPVIADRPGVGKNLQDHVIFGLTHRVSGLTASAFGDSELAASQAALFRESSAGMLTSPGTDVMAFEKIPDSLRDSLSNKTQGILSTNYPEDWPEVEYISLAAYLGSGYEVATADPGDGSNYATLSAVLVAPRSRGSVMITSPDTSVAPDIDPAFLTDEVDVEVGVAAFKRARQFWNSTAMREFSDPEEAYPGYDVQTDSEIVESLRKNFNTIWHGSCTCSMGKTNNTMAVVDSQARVIGVSGLRVVDASAFPFLPPGHPQSAVCKWLSFPSPLLNDNDGQWLTLTSLSLKMPWPKRLRVTSRATAEHGIMRVTTDLVGFPWLHFFLFSILLDRAIGCSSLFSCIVI